MTTFDEIDLTSVPPAKLAKNAVFILAVQRVQKLVQDHRGITLLFEFHRTFHHVLGHRRLGRLYLAMAEGKDPLADLLTDPEEKDE